MKNTVHNISSTAAYQGTMGMGPLKKNIGTHIHTAKSNIFSQMERSSSWKGYKMVDAT